MAAGIAQQSASPPNPRSPEKVGLKWLQSGQGGDCIRFEWPYEFWRNHEYEASYIPGWQATESWSADRKGRIDLSAADPDNPRLASMLALIEGGPKALAETKRVVQNAIGFCEIEALDLLTSPPRPRPIRDCLCFEERLEIACSAATKLQGESAMRGKVNGEL